MSAKEIGEQAAFARTATADTQGGIYNPQQGCTKRELAAMIALQGILAGGANAYKEDLNCNLAILHAETLLDKLAE